MRQIAIVLMTLVAVMIGAAVPASAQLRVDVNQGNIQPMPIAIPDFLSPPNAPPDQNIASVVRADLDRSGLFHPLDQKSFVDRITDINVPPNYANWRVINAQGLVTGQVHMLSDGRMRVAFRLWDVYGQNQMLGQEITGTPDGWRRIAHIISDDIYERITGEKGYFDTRIVYISESGPAINRKKRLTIMDEDGWGPSYLTNGSYMVLTPRFDPKEQTIAYLSYISGKPRVYLHDIESSRQERLGDFPDMTFSPRFSPDGTKLVMSLERNGNSDIYVMDLRTRGLQRLTTDPAIDTAPSYSPDGTKITFESDRGGSQQVYVMNADGTNVHRISFEPGKNGTPVWSPRGDLVAFTNQSPGAFRIGVMRPDGSGARMITDGWEDEGPTWAPNGRVMMFTRTLRGGRGSQIWSVDVTGRNERMVQDNASDPAWSPLLQ